MPDHTKVHTKVRTTDVTTNSSTERLTEHIYVVDTSLFVNPRARGPFGKTPSQAVKGFVQQIKSRKLQIYIPPAIFQELGNFVDSKTMDGFSAYIRIRSASIYELRMPAAVFYDFIEDLRGRINKGLRLAEEFALDNRPNNDEKLKKLREKYRQAMRTGILDSKEDLELVLLAKELGATLVSSDEGALRFAKQLGCSILNAEKFSNVLKLSKVRKTKTRT